MRPITRSASARSAGESAGRSKPAAVALSRIISARPPEPVTTEIPLPRGHRSPWQTASTSLISSRSLTSIARCVFNTSENTRDSPAKPPAWLVIADGGARAAFHRQPHLLRQKRLAVAEDDDVGCLRQIGQTRVADEIADGLIFGVDRIDRSSKADRAERLDDGARGPDAIRGAYNCDRTRFDQRINLHVLTLIAYACCLPLGGPWSKEQRDQDAEQHRAREQRRHHGDDGIGFQPDRFEHLLRQGRCVASGDEDRDYRLVEGVQEGEQRPDQDSGPQHRQRHPEEGVQRSRSSTHGGAFEVAVEALERSGDD